MKKLLLLAVLALLTGCQFGQTPEKEADTADTNTTKIMVDEQTGLKIEVLEEGTGDELTKDGSFMVVHYTGTLEDGSKFDSSLDRGTPFNFTLGGGQVIDGWDKGMLDMKVGEKRRLTIPHEMAYGEAGRPPVIPPKATLIFDVELVEIAKPIWMKQN